MAEDDSTSVNTSTSRRDPVEKDRHSTGVHSYKQWLGLCLAPLLAWLAYVLIGPLKAVSPAPLSDELIPAGRMVAAVAVAMAVLWISEAIPISATALVPIALLPICTGGAVSISEAAAPYAHELIFLFLGGALIAQSMERCGLHRRIALRIILLVGTRPSTLIAGFMLASALLSMWVSNTATIVMMFPVAMSVVELVRTELAKTDDPNRPRPGAPFPFAICLMLGTAYAASIGGIGTLIGTPPNTLLAAFLKEEYGVVLTFSRWMLLGVPLVIIFLPLTWLLLTQVIYPVKIREIPGGRRLIRGELKSLGRVSRGEIGTAIVFCLAGLAWITRPLLVAWHTPSGGQPFVGLTDPGIAMVAGLALFVWPTQLRPARFLMNWEQAKRLPWGILILFGGGLSLAHAIRVTGLAGLLGQSISALPSLPEPVLILLVTALVVFLTELTSNTATTATFLPILGAIAIGLGLRPIGLLIPATIAASCAFMMPAATPPNAIVFASGEISIAQMCKAGLWLNLIGIGLIMALTYGLVFEAATAWGL